MSHTSLIHFFSSDAKSYLLLGISSLQPVANFIQVNIDDQAFILSRTFLYFALIFFSTSLIFVFCKLIFKPSKSFFFSFAIAVAVLIFFNYHIIEPFIHEYGQNLFGLTPKFKDNLYVSLGGLGQTQFTPIDRFRDVVVIVAHIVLYLLILLLGLKISASSKLTFITISVLAVIPIVDLVLAAPLFFASQVPNNQLVAFDEMPPRVKNMEKSSFQVEKPNVYLIIPDGMPSPETVSSILVGYKYKITDQLKQRGFHIVPNSVSNALNTSISVPHFFTMDYFFQKNEKLTPKKKSKILKVHSGYNPVIAEFRKRGYRYLHVDGASYTKCSGYEDVCIGIFPGIIELDRMFLMRTAIHRLKSRLQIPDNLEIPEVVQRLPAAKEGPYFFYAHFSLPHSPFRYKSDCSKKDKPSNSYEGLKKWRSYFKEQLLCTEIQLNLLVNAILERDPTAIIVIQSDHGSSHIQYQNKDQMEWSSEEIRLVLRNFSAFYMPKKCASNLRPGLSPVNTFRLVFSCLDGRVPDLLEDRSWTVNNEKTVVKEVVLQH